MTSHLAIAGRNISLLILLDLSGVLYCESYHSCQMTELTGKDILNNVPVSKVVFGNASAVSASLACIMAQNPIIYQFSL